MRNVHLSTIYRRRSNIIKTNENQTNWPFRDFQKRQNLKLDKDYKQIWTAWIRPTWPVPERSRNTIYRRRSNIIKTNENQLNIAFRDVQQHQDL